MTVSAVSSLTTSTTSTTSSSTSATLSTDDFLQLLMEELQNQNPLDPTDTNDFMNQMMSYATFSQMTELNSSLSDLVSSFDSMLSSNAANYIGRTVEAYGDTTTLSDGAATWGYSLDSDASEVTITIKDSSGNTVWSGSGETSAGSHTFSWDGKTSDGTQLTDGGEYTIEISATDSSGESVYGYTTIIGAVDGVDTSSGSVMLVIGGEEVGIDDVIGIKS